MLKQLTILITFTLTILHPTLAMNPIWQQTVNEELLTTIKSNEPFSLALKIQRLLDAGADPNVQDENDLQKQITTALHYAARNGNKAACKLLLKRGANVDARTDFGWTPLMDAINYPAILKLLLAHGAHVNALTKYNYNALFYAAATNADSCVLLLEHNADPTIQSAGNRTPLINAAAYYQGVNKNTCPAIVNTQARINTAIRTALLCLNRLKKTQPKDQNIGLLYREFKTLLLPHMGLYIPLKLLLNIRDRFGKRAYDYLKIDCLDPDTIEAIYAQNAITEQAEQGWFSNCSIQ